jgi:hypothetical protein
MNLANFSKSRNLSYFSSCRYSSSKSVVLREYLNMHLNSLSNSYFVQNAPVYASEPLNFQEMWGESDYRKAVWNQYQVANGFITPVEIFKPHYAISLVNHIVSVLKVSFGENYISRYSEQNPLVICEIGGGNGNCLKGILDYLKENYPELYSLTQCISIDVSPQFIKQQQITLNDHLERVKFQNRSIFETNCVEVIENDAFVIGLEILDNLPHDKLVIQHDSRILQASINISTDEMKTVQYIEQHVPISDPVIIEFINSLSAIVGVKTESFTKVKFEDDSEKLEAQKDAQKLWNYFDNMEDTGFLKKTIKSWLARFHSKFMPLFGSNNNLITYIPTGSYLLMKFIKHYFPNHYLIMSDFNQIGDSASGVNAPLIQRIVGNTVSEKKTYLDAPLGTYDIFFPTNFNLLAQLYHIVMKSSPDKSQILSTKDFMKVNGNYALTRTKFGYNPLLDDFTNTSFFTANSFRS